MKTLKKCLCLLLALSALLTFTACSSDKNDDENGGSVATGGEWEIDFSGKDYQNYDFTVLRANIEDAHGLIGYSNDIWIENFSNDILANAVYNRNVLLSEMLNVNIVLNHVEQGVKLTNTLEKNTMSGDAPYDLTVLNMRGFPSLIEKGLVKGMEELNLDTSYSWWDKKAENAFNIGGKQYAMISDITYVDKLNTVGVFLNTTMAQNLKLPDFYQMVDNGEWTWEVMKQYSVIASDSGQEIYGLSAQNDFSYYMMHAANIQTVSKNNDGELVYKLPYNRPVNILQDVFTVMNANYFFNRQLDGDLTIDDVAKMFGEQNLFLVRPLTTFYYMKNYYDNYGILPLPKMDDVYDDYYSSINHHAGTLMALPMNNNENERTATVLQAWGMISEKIVNPEFYDKILSTRMVTDVNGSRMLDIIFENRIYDIGLLFNFGSVENVVLKSSKGLLERAPGTVGSEISGTKSSIETAIKEFLK